MRVWHANKSSENHFELWLAVVSQANVLVVLPCRLVSVNLCAVKDVTKDTRDCQSSQGLGYTSTNHSRCPSIAQKTQNDFVTLLVLRFLGTWIYERGYEATTVRDCKLHCSCCGAFIVTSRIVCDPDQYRRDTGVQTCCHQEGHTILHSVIVQANVRDGGISNDCQRQSAKHDDTSKPEPVRRKSDNHSDGGCCGVGWHTEKLGFIRRIS
jgi:hypothetical protein